MVKLDNNEIEARAEALRLELKVQNVERLDLVAVLDALKFSKFLKNYVVVPDQFLVDAAARYNAEEKQIYLSATTDQLMRSGDPRAVWTVAHEIGHLALGHGTRDRKSSGTQKASAGAKVGTEEVDAHRFAAAFLAPSRLVAADENTTVDGIMMRFGLSREAAARRLDELLREFRRKNGILRPLPATVVNFLAEAARRGHVIRPSISSQLKMPIAKARYEGDPCPNPKCGELKMVREGLHTTCDACGTRSGAD